MVRNLPRAATQLNYTRQFLSRDKIRINIPNGVPYEAFDKTGEKIAPWSLMTLFESSRVFSFWPIRNITVPEVSFLDSHILLDNDFYFIATAKVEIDKYFHDIDSPKFPLMIDKELSFIGNSSFKINSSLLHPERSKPYVTCAIQTVLVDSTTRAPKLLPHWWKDKYCRHVKNGSMLKMPVLVKPLVEKCYAFPLTVSLRDTDNYHHSNWTSYIGFCYDAYVHGVAMSQYKYITKDSIRQGIKTLDITYKNESSNGDILDIISWEDESDVNCVKFEIRKNESVCCSANVCFHSPD